MDKRILVAILLCAAASPAAAGPSACLAECAAKYDASEVSCRVKSGSDVVKRCLDAANANYESCKRACAKKYKLDQKKRAPESTSTHPSSGTVTAPPAAPPVK